jgi:serine/threonine-protein kinase
MARSLSNRGAGERESMSFILAPEEMFMEYRILRVLDEGGMGVVYQAVEEYSEDVVAIKCLSPRHMNREHFARRFRQECKFYPKLRHPNIVHMRRAGVSPDNMAFIVMDFLEGKTLRWLLNKSQRFDFLNGLHIMIQVADAMRFAHSKGIWHRDLKPENIMAGTRGDDKGHVWLLDFGIAKSAEGGMNTDDLPDVGTIRYMSPEQARNVYAASRRSPRVKPDGRADIYAFGVICYEVLTGRHTFIDDTDPPSPEDTITGHLLAEPVPIHELVPDCPDTVWPIIKRCIAIDREQRYAKFDEVANELRALLRESVPPGHPLARRVVLEKTRAARRAAFSAVSLESTDEAEERTAIPPEAPQPMEPRTAIPPEPPRSPRGAAAPAPVNEGDARGPARVQAQAQGGLPASVEPIQVHERAVDPAFATTEPEPPSRVTEPLVNFVPSRSALPFVSAAQARPRELRGRGFTVKIPVMSPRPRFPSGGFFPLQGPPPVVTNPATPAMPPGAATPPSPATPPRPATSPRGPTPPTPASMTTTLQPSTRPYWMAPLIGLAITVAGTVGVLAGRATLSRSPLASASAEPVVSLSAAPPATPPQPVASGSPIMTPTVTPVLAVTMGPQAASNAGAPPAPATMPTPAAAAAAPSGEEAAGTRAASPVGAGAQAPLTPKPLRTTRAPSSPARPAPTRIYKPLFGD